MTTRIFFLYFLRDQKSQHFNEDLPAVNASAFSFVLCFKSIVYRSASYYVISANGGKMVDDDNVLCSI